MINNIHFVGDSSQTFLNFRADLANALILHGNSVSASLNTESADLDELSSLGVDVFEHSVNNRTPSILGVFKLLGSLWRLRKVTSVYVSYFFVPNFVCALFSLFIPRCRFVAFVEGLGQLGAYPVTLRSKVLIFIYSLVLSRFDSVVVLNQGDRRLLTRFNPFLNSKIKLIPGIGVSVDKYPFSNFDLRCASNVVLFIGRLLDQKGVRLFIELAERYKMVNPDFKFKLLGDFVEDGSGVSRREANDISSRNCNIEFLGRVPIQKYLSSARLVCLPTWYGEGMPRVLLESMVSGCPVVTSSMPGCSELVKHNRTGFIYDVTDPVQFEVVVGYALSMSYASMNKIVEEARRSVEDWYSNEALLPVYIETILGSCSS